ncbi:MAG: glycosyltransferase [Acidobacteria bacterium]|nr:glycosyltransferase [Acidobacteriota bacterium]
MTAGSPETAVLSYVVPTVGGPPHLAECLESIYRDASETAVPAELIVVWQQPAAPATGAVNDPFRDLAGRLAADHTAAFRQAPRIVQFPRPAGFARAANAGIAASRGLWIALVNDDAVLETGWTRALLEALGASAGADPKASSHFRVAAAQGINLFPAESSDVARIDGAGLAWNSRWQAVQVDRGASAPPPGGAPTPVYGVSATATLYRRDALAAVSPGSGQLRPFNERLDSYYEDVELADRLRRASYGAMLVPAARTEHAGALSSRGRRAARRRVRRIYCNRLLVLAARLGRSFWLRLPLFLLRDAVDVFGGRKGELPGDPRRPGPLDLLFAWCRAVRLLPRFAGFGRPQSTWAPAVDPGPGNDGGTLQ